MELIKYLPDFYHEAQEVRNIQASLSSENTEVKQCINDVLNQLFIDTATWGLDYWEKILALQSDTKESLENRRARIKTRLRGTGTVTRDMIKNVCESFVNGKVDIIENTNDYSFVIKFIDIKGVPGNVDYLKSSIEEIKPAHLSFSFEFLYNTWNSIKTLTWEQIKTSTWGNLKTREVI